MKRYINATGRARRLNGRQRKKLHVGEFSEYTFHLELGFHDALADDSLDKLMDDLFEFLELRGLLAAGFGGRMPIQVTDGVVGAIGRGSPTEEDREAVVQWLRARPEVAEARALEFINAWHS